MNNVLMSPLISVLALIVTLGILITVHEFGHFWVARRLGVKVLRFSVGFGRALWLRRGADGTEYVIAAIPLGGYVRMLDEREGDVDPRDRERAFNRQSVWTRIAIVAAGPVFNFLFAIVAYALMFMVGVSGLRPLLDSPAPDSRAAMAGFEKGELIVAVDEGGVRTLNEALLALVDSAMAGGEVQVQVRDRDERLHYRTLDMNALGDAAEQGRLLDALGLVLLRPQLPPVIDRVVPGGAAERAGLAPGDRVLVVGDEPVRDWQQWASYVRAHPGSPLEIQIERDGERLFLEVTPEAMETQEGLAGRVGAAARVPEAFSETFQVKVRYNLPQAVWEAVGKTWHMSLFTLRMLARILIGKASLENISGPIAIAQFAGQSASIGNIPFLSFKLFFKIFK